MKITGTRTLNKVKNTLRDHKKELAKKYNIIKIGIFGSLVTGHYTKKSDIDVLVDIKRNGYLRGFSYYEPLIYIQDLLHENKIKRKVDAVFKKDLYPVYKKYILKEVVYL